MFAFNAARGPVEATASISNSGGEVISLQAPESALVTLNDFEALESSEQRVKLVNTFKLTYGTLVWMNDDNLAACLLPSEKGSPLATVGLLNLGNGNLTTVLSKAVGSKERFEIYDVRATSSGMIWTEANILDGAWRVYAAKLSGTTAGEPQLLEEGDATYDTPTLAICESRAFWQVLPKAPNDQGLTSRLMGVTLGENNPAVVFESARRMGTPPYSADGSIVISPRLDLPALYYQLTNIDAETGKVLDHLTMPQGMMPLEAGYGSTGFMFSLPDIYNNNTAISNLGTYTPRSKPEDGNYSKARWFGFARTPSAAPAWCGDLLLVKSSYSVCGVDLNASHYFAIDVDDGADTYGDYLATSGTHPTFATYANIDHQPVNAKAIHACYVKLWSPHELTAPPKDKDQNATGENAEGATDGNVEDEIANPEEIGTETIEA